MKSLRVQSALGLLLRPCASTPISSQVAFQGLRALSTTSPHQAKTNQKAPKIPKPTPFVPDVETFLTLIGRDLKSHASKFPSWESLFSLNTDQLRELGLEPPRSRRYLLRWRDKFRQGKYGPGGDLKYVENGTAILKVREIVKSPLAKLRQVVNVPVGKEVDEVKPEEMIRPLGFKVQGIRTIVGPYALPMKEGGARITVTEGMWEDRRGHKVDGGERRQAEVRFKRKVAERKALREAQGFY
ncbi:IGR protein motif-domain-containing protein [Podospora australis]|uniref:Small ribosomal subunit protein mS41 n=1 Tax=Podospora australis TaxID=1536484 RepID=A0AAN6X502_9PEZI|nr:IGR protein motif-domain-containing protein [Podospora australis]